MDCDEPCSDNTINMCQWTNKKYYGVHTRMKENKYVFERPKEKKKTFIRNLHTLGSGSFNPA